MVLPLLLLFIFGIIDVGRLMWTWNRAEKATQMGARFAVVTDMVPPRCYPELRTLEWCSRRIDPFPRQRFRQPPPATMWAAPDGWGYDAAAFNDVVGADAPHDADDHCRECR